MQTLESTIDPAVEIQHSAAHGQQQPDPLTIDGNDDGLALAEMVVMMIDDEPIITKTVKKYLENAGFKRIVTCCESSEALEAIQHEQPDVVLLDLNMPEVGGFEILSSMRSAPALKRIPVIVLTSSDDADTKLESFKRGAADFLVKPVHAGELVLRLKNILTAKAYHDQVTRHTALLEHQVRLRTNELKAAQLQILHSLASAGEFRDEVTGMHVVRVGRYSGALARYLGASDDWVEMIEHAAPLHDVGKIGIPDAILLKPGPLEPSEYEVMKQHGIMGTQIICPASRRRLAAWADDELLDVTESPIMKMAAVIAETHHEKWDGSGYPKGLKGEEIPPEGRIVAVADVYDALSNERPYKKAFSREKSFEIIEEGRGVHFDPRVVDAFFATVDEILKIQLEFSD
ncbi:MAG: response regulator [Pirellulaceae bacterium]|jgi:putative two-component system response regulator|nr:response regulator [Pirellulaceae bacterium]